MKLSNELFSEASQYFTRLDAEDLRVTSHAFNGFADQLREVFGYKLRLSYLSIAKGTNARVSIKLRSTCGRETSFEDGEVQAMARLKGAVRVGFVRNCEINAKVVSKRLCGLFPEACSETTVHNMLLVDRPMASNWDEMECAALQNFLLAFNISGVLNLQGGFRHGDFTRDFLLRCKEKGIQTLLCNFALQHPIDLQGMPPEEVDRIVQVLVLPDQ